MMKTVKKPYIAPSAELILLAPLEALANQQTLSTGDQIALNKWGKNVFSPASVTSNRTYWGDNGKINKK